MLREPKAGKIGRLHTCLFCPIATEGNFVDIIDEVPGAIMSGAIRVTPLMKSVMFGLKDVWSHDSGSVRPKSFFDHLGILFDVLISPGIA
jgi:hypothetical protein